MVVRVVGGCRTVEMMVAVLPKAVLLLWKVWSSSGSAQWWLFQVPNVPRFYMVKSRQEGSVSPPGQGISQWNDAIL